ncbi:MAG: thermonuclease family protein [Planctomycetota bacterium]
MRRRSRASTERAFAIAAILLAALLLRRLFRPIELRPPERAAPPAAESRSARRPSDGTGWPGFSGAAAVVRAIDGDTALLRSGEEVRYAGIDAPEAGEAFAEEARAANEALVAGQELELRPAGSELKDRYGRLLAAVQLAGESPDGLCVNVELVRRGLASVYQTGPESIEPALRERLLEAQSEAISERRGIWKDRLARAEKLGPELVSTRFRIHRRGCPELKYARPRRVTSVEQECRAGKSFCRRCRPLGD